MFDVGGVTGTVDDVEGSAMARCGSFADRERDHPVVAAP
jgi:hypothetical protein